MSKSASTALTGARIQRERAGDAGAVFALIETAFGPGRYAKAAERLREGRPPPTDLAFVAWDGEIPVGCVRLWPIRIGETAALLLGPIAVDERFRNRGLGAALVDTCCAAAQNAGQAVVLLVGDAPYFGKAGFVEVPPGRIGMPGPVDARRVLWKALRADALAGVEGAVEPA